MSDKILPITMPKWGMEMTEGTITNWYFEEGDEISDGDEILDIETEKLSNPYESEGDAVLRKRIGEEDEVYPVGALIGIMADEDVSDDDIQAFIEAYVPPTLSDEPAPAAAAPAASAEAPPDTGSRGYDKMPAADVENFISTSNLDISPIAAQLAADAGIDLSKATGTGRLGRISVADVEKVAGGPLGRKATASKASPVARRLAKQKGIDLSMVQGSGGRGRILKRDVESAQTGGTVSVGPATFRTEKNTKMRDVIARRLVQSKTQAPHFYLRVELNMGELMKLRAGVNKRLNGKKVSVNDFIIRATGLALREVPEANVQFGDGEMRHYNQADVGVAVAVDNGLVTPVVRGACRKSLVQIADEVADLANRAREGGLKPADIEGGTISVSNLGMYGISSFDAVINIPQGSILAVGVVEERPANVDGELKLAPMMHVTMSCDHRAIDGAVGAKFLAAFKELIENPVSLVM